MIIAKKFGAINRVVRRLSGEYVCVRTNERKTYIDLGSPPLVHIKRTDYITRDDYIYIYIYLFSFFLLFYKCSEKNVDGRNK